MSDLNAPRPPRQSRKGTTSTGARKAASKSGRSRAREFALQALYQYIVSGNEPAAIDLFTRDLAGFHKADVAHYDAVLHGCITVKLHGRRAAGDKPDVGDSADFFGNLAHGLNGAGHRLFTGLRFAGGLGGQAVGMAGAVGVLFDGRAHLLDGRSGFLYRRGLGGRRLRQRLRGGGHLVGGVAQLV